MRTMTYNNLMKKCDNGQATVTAWADKIALVTFYKRNGRDQREEVEVTNIPDPRIEKAKALGEAAFHNGQPAAPVLDANLIALLDPTVGNNTKVLQAWHKGWQKASEGATSEQ